MRVSDRQHPLHGGPKLARGAGEGKSNNASRFHVLAITVTRHVDDRFRPTEKSIIEEIGQARVRPFSYSRGVRSAAGTIRRYRIFRVASSLQTCSAFRARSSRFCVE